MAEKYVRLEVIEPSGIFYEGQVAMVEYNTTEGEVGVYPDHIPMTQIIAPGILRITEADGQKEAALHSGFVEITQDLVTIMAESVEWPDEIDQKRAEEAKIRAERRLSTEHEGGVDIQRAELALKKALIRLQLSEKY